MKKRINIMFALLAGAMGFASCGDDAVVEETAKQTKDTVVGNMTFTACMPGNDDDVATRTVLGSNGASVLWSEDDAISVFSSADGQNTRFTLKSGAGTKSGSFEGSIEQRGSKYYAFYPYDEANSIIASETNPRMTYNWNGASQTAVKGSFPTNTPMVALTNTTPESTTASLAFKNICAYVKVTTDYPCSSIMLTAKNTSFVLAAKTIDVSVYGDQILFDTQSKDESHSITLSGKDGAILEAGTYYIAVLPCELSGGFELSFTNQYKEKTWTKSTTKTVKLERNKVLNLGEIAIKSEMVKMAGSGTATDPYLIHDFDQLQHMRDFVNTSTGGGDCYKQVADIDGGGAEFTPIGKIDGSELRHFAGTYDGGGFAIRNIKVGTDYTDRMFGSDDVPKCYVTALFAYVFDATIKNLTVENIDITGISGTVDNPRYIKSPLIGVAFGSGNSNTTVENVTVTGAQTAISGLKKGVYFTFGGIIAVSRNHLNITNCTNHTMFSNYVNANYLRWGGIVGSAYAVKNSPQESSDKTVAHININKCRNDGNFTETVEFVSACIGGILGYGWDNDNLLSSGEDIIPIIKNCVNFGSIQCKSSASAYAGGIVGHLDSDGYHDEDPYIENSINNGSVSADVQAGLLSTSGYVGGILGYCYDGDPHFINCANIGTLSGAHTGNIYGATLNGATPHLSGCDTQSSLADYISVMNTNRLEDYCAWKYADGSNNTKLDLDF